MAVATGTPIRPELSAVDYTPFLQAAGQSAQMQVAGSAAIAKGIESLVGKVGQAIAEKKAETEGVQLIKEFFPDVDEKTARYGLKAAGGPIAFIKFKTDYNKFIKSETDQKKAAEYASALQTGGPIDTAALDRKSTRLNSSHVSESRMPSSA